MKRPIPHDDERPWGRFRRFTLNEATTVKIITVERDHATSLQTHNHRSELWRILEGVFELDIGNESIMAHRGDEIWIESGVKHRIKGLGERNSLLEISFGEFDENDIIRHEDRYGRA